MRRATARRYARSARGLLRSLRRGLRALRAWPPLPRVLAAAAIVLVLWLVINGVYQAYRKPTELLSPVSGVLAKKPDETWRSYGALFREHSTAIITPTLLAALAQVESTGDPVARTPWRFRPARNPFKVYRPASSAVGMYQITDAAFDEARRYCIHDHVVVEDGPWFDPSSCWFNGLYSRVVPTHAIEMTSALLDRQVSGILGRRPIANASPEHQQDLAAVIHLCGASVGQAYARRGFRLTAHQRCGDQNISGYLGRVNALKRQFARLTTPG